MIGFLVSTLIFLRFQVIFARAAPMPQLDGFINTGRTLLSSASVPLQSILGKTA